MTKTLPITQARDEFPTLVKNASHKLDEYIITVNGSPAAVLISASEYESWKETMDILSNPSLLKSIKLGETELKQGKSISFDDLKKSLQ